jgi:hypothetical protein
VNMQMMEAAFAENGIPWPNGETANGTAIAKRRFHTVKTWFDRYVGPRARMGAMMFGTEIITIVPVHALMEKLGLM